MEFILILVVIWVLVAPVMLIMLFSRFKMHEEKLEAMDIKIAELYRSHREMIFKQRTETKPTPASQPLPEPKPAPVLEQKPEPPPAPKPEPELVRAPEPALTKRPDPTPDPKAVPAPTPPRPQPPPIEPTAVELFFESCAKSIQDWFLLTGRFAPQGMNREFAVASAWLLRVGVAVVLIGTAFFLKYAIAKGFFPPTVRCVMTGLTGASLIAWGYHLLGKKYDVLGQAFIGLGLLLLYFTFFAAVALFSLISLTTAFACMAAVTVLAGFIAVRSNLLSIALLGLIGGYATPLLLSSPDPNALLLYGYLFLLGIGVLGVSLLRRWPVLPACSALMAYAVTTLFLNGESAFLLRDLVWLSAIHLLCLAAVTLGPIRRRELTQWHDWIMLLASTAIYWAWVLSAAFGPLVTRSQTGLLALAIAAASAGIAFLCRFRRHADLILEELCFALAAVFTVMAAALLVGGNWLTPVWAFLAAMLGRILVREKHPALLPIFWIFIVLILLRGALIDLPACYGGNRLAALGTRDFLIDTAKRWVILGSIPAMFFSLFKSAKSDPAFRNAFPGAALISAALFLTIDVFSVSHGFFDWGSTSINLVTPVWLAALFFAHRYLSLRVVNSMIGLVILKVVVDAFPMVMLIGSPAPAAWLGTTVRFTLPAVLALIVLAVMSRRANPPESLFNNPRFPFAAFLVILTGFYLSLEIAAVTQCFFPGSTSTALSIFWSLYALTLIIQGLRLRITGARYGGLTLLAAVILKLFILDLSGTETLYRILTFIGVGVLLIFGSFLYLRFREKYDGAL